MVNSETLFRRVSDSGLAGKRVLVTGGICSDLRSRGHTACCCMHAQQSLACACLLPGVLPPPDIVLLLAAYPHVDVVIAQQPCK